MDKQIRFPTWPDGTPRLLKPGEYVGFKHETIKGKGVLTPVIMQETIKPCGPEHVLIERTEVKNQKGES